MFRPALFFLALVSLSAEGTDWVFVKRGWEALRQRELSEAFAYFSEARAMRDRYSEADFGLGMVYAAELNYLLALSQFDAALDVPFENPEYRYLMAYQRARIVWNQQDFLRFERTLEGIVADELQFSDPGENWIRVSARRSAQGSSVDRLLVLYRVDSGFAFVAHRELGIYLSLSGRDSALDHLLFAYLHSATKLIDAIRARTPDYSYTTLEDLLARAASFEEVAAYVEESGFHRILYHLALAYRLYDAASKESTRLFRFLSQQENAGRWASRAEEQLSDPFFPLMADFYPELPTAY